MDTAFASVASFVRNKIKQVPPDIAQTLVTYFMRKPTSLKHVPRRSWDCATVVSAVLQTYATQAYQLYPIISVLFFSAVEGDMHDKPAAFQIVLAFPRTLPVRLHHKFCSNFQ